MSDELRRIEKELEELKQRVEKLESVIRERREVKEEEEIEKIFEIQREMPKIRGYDIWSIVIARDKKSHTLRISLKCSGERVKSRELSPEEAAILASALSHPARIAILKETLRSSQYSSELEDKLSKYGALHHHLNVLMDAGLIEQERRRGKYVITPAGRVSLLFLNVLASILESLKTAPIESKEASFSKSGVNH